MEKYYLNPDNTYWGSVVDGEDPPFDGAVEVPFPPDSHASQVWDGSEWSAYIPVIPLEQRLNSIFQKLTAAVRAQFYTLTAAVKIALDSGDTEAARLIIQNTPVPTELEALKQQMLGEF